MNTRGLVELIVSTPTLFTMVVIMELVATFMTGPLLNVVDRYLKNDLGHFDFPGINIISRKV